MDRFGGDVGGVGMAGELRRECHSSTLSGDVCEALKITKLTSGMKRFSGHCL